MYESTQFFSFFNVIAAKHAKQVYQPMVKTQRHHKIITGNNPPPPLSGQMQAG